KPMINNARKKAQELGEKTKETTIERIKDAGKEIGPNLTNAKNLAIAKTKEIAEDEVTKIILDKAKDIAIEEAKKYVVGKTVETLRNTNRKSNQP
ncbi:MAG: hypothetical protein ACTSVZ_07255, partial [Promethearchaeota archaeon]